MPRLLAGERSEGGWVLLVDTRGRTAEEPLCPNDVGSGQAGQLLLSASIHSARGGLQSPSEWR